VVYENTNPLEIEGISGLAEVEGRFIVVEGEVVVIVAGTWVWYLGMTDAIPQVPVFYLCTHDYCEMPNFFLPSWE